MSNIVHSWLNRSYVNPVLYSNILGISLLSSSSGVRVFFLSVLICNFSLSISVYFKEQQHERFKFRVVFF